LTCRRAQAPRQQFLAWSDARTLARIVYKDARVLHHTIYLLDAGHATLLWEEPPGEHYAPVAQQQAAAEWQASARRLATLIAAHTNLPLLDLSAAAHTLVEKATNTTALALMNDAYFAAINEQNFAAALALWGLMEPREQAFLNKIGWSPNARMKPGTLARMSQRTARLNALNPTSAQTRRAWLRLAQALIPYYPAGGANAHATPERQRSLRLERRRKTVNRFLLWSQVAMVALLIVAGVGLKLSGAYMERVASGMPQRVQRETPLYTSSFRYPHQGDWPLHTPTKTDTSSLEYVDGAYQLTDSNRAYSVTSHTSAIIMRDGAEQVTVTELGHVDENNLAWVGLLLDANADGSTFTTFMIDELGDWSLSHFDGSLLTAQQWSTPDAGQSDAVRRGAGATNTLLLIRRGNFYLLYVNGASVDTFSDGAHALSPGGFVGVYLDEGGYIARFNDFVVYPAPTDLPFWMR
jgi:hypothetical protein